MDIKKTPVFIFIVLIILSVIPVHAEKIQEQIDEIRLESAREEMPDMNIFCYISNEKTEKNVKITYGEQKLKPVQVVPFSQTGEGISYYIMLDISGSISNEYFNQIKPAIIQFQQNMKPEDDLTLITFGNEVNIILQNSGQTENISDKIQALNNIDENTLLFQAIQKTAELADKRDERLKRKIAVAITDGEDFSQNTATQSEALAALKEKSIPLYGLAIREKKNGEENPYIDQMGEFARSSGGILKVFGLEEAAIKMNELQELFQQAYVIKAEAETNHVSYTVQPLTISFEKDNICTMDVTAVHYKIDSIKPTAEVKKVSSKKLEVTFSEPVKNAKDASSYQIVVDKNQPIPVYAAKYSKGKKGVKAVLSFEKKLVNGNYSITFQGITDDSMEENPLTESVSLKVTNGGEQKKEGFFRRNQGIAAGLISGVIFLVASAAGIYILKRRKGLVTVEGKAILQDNVNKKHHVMVEKKEKVPRQIQFLLEGVKEDKNRIFADVEGSIFVGRSQICDIYIDDEKMSKQHFVIYATKEGFDIEDLKSTNGTKVNGTKIYTRTELVRGDKIKAGGIQMTVRW